MLYVKCIHISQANFISILYYIIIIIIVVVIVAVQFLSDTSSAVESDGTISFTLMSSVPSDMPFSVQVCTRDLVPQSAAGLFIFV